MFVLVSGVIKMIIIFSWAMGDSFFCHGHVSPLCLSLLVGSSSADRGAVLCGRWFIQFWVLDMKFCQSAERDFYPRLAGWWFPRFFIFTATWGRFPIWRSYFSKGLVQPPTRLVSEITTPPRFGWWFIYLLGGGEAHQPSNLERLPKTSTPGLPVMVVELKSTGLSDIWFEKGHSCSEPLKSCIINPQNV